MCMSKPLEKSGRMRRPMMELKACAPRPLKRPPRQERRSDPVPPNLTRAELLTSHQKRCAASWMHPPKESIRGRGDPDHAPTVTMTSGRVPYKGCGADEVALLRAGVRVDHHHAPHFPRSH